MIAGTNTTVNSFIEGLNTDTSPMYMKSSQYIDLVDINTLISQDGKTGDLSLINNDLVIIQNITPSLRQLVFAKSIGDYLIVCYELNETDYRNVIVQYKFENGLVVEGPIYLTGDSQGGVESNIRFGRTLNTETNIWSDRGVVDTELVYTRDDSYKLYITDGLGITSSINIGLNPRLNILNRLDIQTDTTLSGTSLANVTVELNTLTRVGSLGLPVGDHNIILRVSRLGLLYDFIQLPGSIKLSNLSINTIQDGSNDSSNQLINLIINNKGDEVLLITIYDVYYDSYTNYSIRNYGSVRIGRGLNSYSIDNNKLVSEDVDESDVQSIANLIFSPTYVTSLNGRNYYANGQESYSSSNDDGWDLFTMQYGTNLRLDNTLNIGSETWVLRGNYSTLGVIYSYNDSETHDPDRFDMSTGALLPLPLLLPGLMLIPLNDNEFQNPATSRPGGIGKNIEYDFTVLRLLSDNLAGREGIDGSPNSLIMGNPLILPHPSKKCNQILIYEGGLSQTPVYDEISEYDDQSSYYWDYHNYMISSKYMGYQRDSIYPFAVQLTYDDGSKSLLKFIGYVKTPSARISDFRLFDYHDLSDSNENHAVSSYPLGVTFKMNNLPSNVQSVTVFRGKRSQADRPLFGTGIISPMTKMVDGSYGLSTIFTSGLSYSIFGFLGQQYNGTTVSEQYNLTSLMYTDVIRLVPYGENPTMFLIVSPDISYTNNVPGLYNIEMLYGLGTRVGALSDQVTPTGNLGAGGITPNLILRQANSSRQTVVLHTGEWHGFGSMSRFPYDKENTQLGGGYGFNFEFNTGDPSIPEATMLNFWSRLSWSSIWADNGGEFRNRYAPPNITNCLTMSVCDTSLNETLLVRVRPASSYTDFSYSNPLVEIEPTNPNDNRTNGTRFGIGFVSTENYNNLTDQLNGSAGNWFGYKLYKPYTGVWAANITNGITVNSYYRYLLDESLQKLLRVKASQVLDMALGLSFLTYSKSPLFVDGTRFYNNVLDYVHTDDENQKLSTFFSYGGTTPLDDTDRFGLLYFSDSGGAQSLRVSAESKLPFGNSSRKLIVKIEHDLDSWDYNVPTCLSSNFYSSSTPTPIRRVWDLQYFNNPVSTQSDLIQYARPEGNNHVVVAELCGGTTEAVLSTLIVNLRQNVLPYSGLSSFGLSSTQWVAVGTTDEIQNNYCKLTVFNGDTYIGPYVYNHRYPLNEILENADETFGSELNLNDPSKRVNSLTAYHFYWYMAESSVNPGLVSGQLPRDVSVENGMIFDLPQVGEVYKYNPRAYNTVVTTDITQETKLYLYNTLFSQDGYPNNIVYNEEIDYALSNTTTDHPYRIWLSELDTSYDPLDDGRLYVKVNNYIDLDLKYGKITSIVPYNSYILLFQERGVLLVTTLPRDVVTTENSLLLTIGTGQLLSRYDYLSEIYGKPLSVTDYVKDQTGVWWYDRDNNEACYVTGNQVLLMSTTLTVKTLHNNITPDSTYLSYDSKDNEIYLSHYINDDNVMTLRYSDLSKRFITRHSDGVRNTVFFQNDLYKINNTDLSQHELGLGYKPGMVQFIAGNDSAITKVFDVTLIPMYDNGQYSLSLNYLSELNQRSLINDIHSEDIGEVSWVNGRNREGTWYIPTRTELNPDRLRGRYLMTSLQIAPITTRFGNVNLSNVVTTFRQSKF